MDANEAEPEETFDTLGEELFRTRRAEGNVFACATCHSLNEADEGAPFRRVGHPLTGVLSRETYKNGALEAPLDAVNSCLQEWMAAEPWDEESEEWTELSAFLLSETETGSSEPLSFSIVQPPEPEQLADGDKEAGQALFNTSCAACHGKDAKGANTAPPLLNPALDAELISRRVRTSGAEQSAVYDGLTGGRMPFWSEERLTDAELSDLVAFITLNASESDPDPGDATPTGGSGRNCDATHELVGAVGELENRLHGVGGTVTVIDDCTLEVTDFTYDGTGVNVRWYGGKNGNFGQGQILGGEQLLRSGGYNGETIRVELDLGVTLDDFDSVSVWCVPIRIDFGSTILKQP